MPTVTIAIPDDLSAQLEPYRDTLAEVLRIGLLEVKKAQGLALYKHGHLSLWKAARLAGVSRRGPVRRFQLGIAGLCSGRNTAR